MVTSNNYLMYWLIIAAGFTFMMNYEMSILPDVYSSFAYKYWQTDVSNQSIFLDQMTKNKTLQMQRSFWTGMKQIISETARIRSIKTQAYEFSHRLSFQYNTTVNYVIVGACDGLHGSIDKYIFNDAKLGNFRGIMMEASPVNFALLSNRINNTEFSPLELRNKVMLINGAFANETNFEQIQQKSITFHVMNVTKLAAMLNISADDREQMHWAKYQINSIREVKAPKLYSCMEEVNVTSFNAMDMHRTLSSNVDLEMDRKHVIDLLQIDTEGYDAVVVRNYLLWCREYLGLLPMYIEFENKILKQQYPAELESLMTFLNDIGYYTMLIGEDTICILKAV